MKSSKKSQVIIVSIGVIIIFLLFIIELILKEFPLFGYDSLYLTEIIYALTGLVILWYTRETALIREITQENSNKSKRPIITHELYLFGGVCTSKAL